MSEVVQINQMQLKVKEFQTQRVVTFKEIDELHERAEGTAKRNFFENKDRFLDGVDYFIITPSQKDEFRTLEIPNRGLTLITESGYLMLVKSFTDDLAWQVQRELVNNYFRGKQQFKLPINFAEALRELAATWEEKQQLQLHNQEMKPKVEMYDILLSSNNAQTMSEVAKVLGWGRNKLFAYLRDIKLLMRNNLPYQKYIDQGLFDVREVTTVRGDNQINVTQTLVTPKGIEYIGRKLLYTGALVKSGSSRYNDFTPDEIKSRLSKYFNLAND